MNIFFSVLLSDGFAVLTGLKFDIRLTNQLEYQISIILKDYFHRRDLEIMMSFLYMPLQEVSLDIDSTL